MRVGMNLKAHSKPIGIMTRMNRKYFGKTLGFIGARGIMKRLQVVAWAHLSAKTQGLAMALRGRLAGMRWLKGNHNSPATKRCVSFGTHGLLPYAPQANPSRVTMITLKFSTPIISDAQRLEYCWITGVSGVTKQAEQSISNGSISMPSL